MATTEKQPAPEPVESPAEIRTSNELRGDLIGKTTNDVSPNCPKAKSRKTDGECGVCLILPGDINGKKKVQCEFCGQIFASKQTA